MGKGHQPSLPANLSSSASREAEEGDCAGWSRMLQASPNILDLSRGEGVPPTILPVDNAVCLFSPNNAESIDGCVRWSKMWVLVWSPSKASAGALTAAQELAHTRHRGKTKGKLSFYK